MTRPTVDIKRDIKASAFSWADNGYPDYGEPGSGSRHRSTDLYSFACPGCGRFAGIQTRPMGSLKPNMGASWEVTHGSLDDVTTLSLSPSINCVGCCKWHGHLVHGEFKSC